MLLSISQGFKTFCCLKYKKRPNRYVLSKDGATTAYRGCDRDFLILDFSRYLKKLQFLDFREFYSIYLNLNNIVATTADGTSVIVKFCKLSAHLKIYYPWRLCQFYTPPKHDLFKTNS